MHPEKYGDSKCRALPGQSRNAVLRCKWLLLTKADILPWCESGDLPKNQVREQTPITVFIGCNRSRKQLRKSRVVFRRCYSYVSGRRLRLRTCASLSPNFPGFSGRSPSRIRASSSSKCATCCLNE